MNEKFFVIIPLLIFIIVGELIAITITQVQQPAEMNTTILGSTNEREIVPDPVKKYCENYNYGGDKLLQTVEKSKSVAKCGNHYRVEPPVTAVNAPFKMIDKKGEVVAICGAMSFDASIESFEQKECEESCDLENLCTVK